MNRWLYSRLAADNLKKNSKTYIPYLFTCMMSVMMYYIIITLSMNEELNLIRGGGTIRSILKLGGRVITLFVTIFLIYTNSFLMKRRKKEFAVFQILGMEKKHIAKVLCLETLYTAAAGLTGGLLGGLVLSKLLYLLLIRILNRQIPYGFHLYPEAVFQTARLFGVIFLIVFATNLLEIHTSTPVGLLRGSRAGEKEPRANWFLALLGIACITAGYYLAVTTLNPAAAIPAFFVAVLLVIIGTYCLFTAGSIILLKLLKKNKGFYYQTRHFISVSGMMFRMKQNAAGLASICILSTAVLVMLSSTAALYAGMKDVYRNRYPREVLITRRSASEDCVRSVHQVVDKALAQYGLRPESPVSYRYVGFSVMKNEDGKSFDVRADSGEIADFNRVSYLYFVPLEDYNAVLGESLNLEQDEVFVLSGTGYEENELGIFGRTFRVKEGPYQGVWDGADIMTMMNSLCVIVPDMRTVEEMAEKQAGIFGEHASDLSYYYGFDLPAEDEQKKAVFEVMNGELSALPYGGYQELACSGWEEISGVYAGLLFLGIFLGTLFVMATVLIIYYKQVSEGYEDRNRFEIMQNVGLGEKEIRSSIRSQILIMFFLPLVTAAVHITFAFPMITRLLSMLQFTNVKLYVFSTAAVVLAFAVMYLLVYSVTSRVYYQIVRK